MQARLNRPAGTWLVRRIAVVALLSVVVLSLSAFGVSRLLKSSAKKHQRSQAYPILTRRRSGHEGHRATEGAGGRTRSSPGSKQADEKPDSAKPSSTPPPSAVPDPPVEKAKEKTTSDKKSPIPVSTLFPGKIDISARVAALISNLAKGDEDEKSRQSRPSANYLRRTRIREPLRTLCVKRRLMPRRQFPEARCLHWEQVNPELKEPVFTLWSITRPKTT